MKSEKKRWINTAKIILGSALLFWKVFGEKKIIKKEKVNAATKNKWEENAEWLKANPKSLPYPTYWPFFLAVGLVLLFWGILTSWVISLVGLLVFIISLAGWINILRYEKRINKN